MTAQEILSSINELRKHQGFYQKVYETITNDENSLLFLVKQNFKDITDLVLFLES